MKNFLQNFVWIFVKFYILSFFQYVNINIAMGIEEQLSCSYDSLTIESEALTRYVDQT